MPILRSIPATWPVLLESMSVLSSTDIFPEPLTTDRIVDHQQGISSALE
jgi:hypothetical protein